MADHSPTSVAVLGELLDRWADERPDDEALTDGRERLSWAEYRDRSTDLAAELVRSDVRPGDRVGVHLPKSIWSFVSVHAVLRAGAVVVPVDWFAPPAYAADVLADAGVTALVSTATNSRLEAVRGSIGQVLDPMAGFADGDVPSDQVGPNDPAYIIYTSGSTGPPKGIVHTHSSALAYARLATETYELTTSDRLVNFAPLHFDQSTFELYAGPLAGAAAVVVPDAMMRFPASLSKLLAAERGTVWYTVPFAISQLVARGALDERDLSSLRWVLYGGESFAPGALAAAMRLLPHTRFSNVYGPAEVNQCTFHHLDVPPSGSEPIPIGRAWSGADVRIVDGELWVSAPTMMREYWRRPELTESSIVVEAGRRWYRTGDLVHQRPDGELVFAGRADHQVKVRGYRIELEAVESAINDHAAVEACAVVVDRDGIGDVLVAIVAPTIGDAELAELGDSLQARLPRSAVPHEILTTTRLPRTGTGKVDRSAAHRVLQELRAATAEHAYNASTHRSGTVGT